MNKVEKLLLEADAMNIDLHKALRKEADLLMIRSVMGEELTVDACIRAIAIARAIRAEQRVAELEEFIHKQAQQRGEDEDE